MEKKNIALNLLTALAVVCITAGFYMLLFYTSNLAGQMSVLVSIIYLGVAIILMSVGVFLLNILYGGC